MLNPERKHWGIIGISVAVISLCLLYIAIRLVLGNDLVLRNYISFMVFSVLVGGAASVFVYFRWKIILFVYLIGMAVGYIEMFRAFSDGMSGWGDLVGLMSLFTWTIIGLASGVFLHIGYMVYKKIKKN